MKLNIPLRLSPIGFAIMAGILGTFLVLAYQSFTTPDGSAVFPTDTTDKAS